MDSCSGRVYQSNRTVTGPPRHLGSRHGKVQVDIGSRGQTHSAFDVLLLHAMSKIPRCKLQVRFPRQISPRRNHWFRPPPLEYVPQSLARNSPLRPAPGQPTQPGPGPPTSPGASPNRWGMSSSLWGTSCSLWGTSHSLWGTSHTDSGDVPQSLGHVHQSAGTSPGQISCPKSRIPGFRSGPWTGSLTGLSEKSGDRLPGSSWAWRGPGVPWLPPGPWAILGPIRPFPGPVATANGRCTLRYSLGRCAWRLSSTDTSAGPAHGAALCVRWAGRSLGSDRPERRGARGARCARRVL